MSRPDEGVIHAWLDGELEPAEAARVQRLAETDPEWMAAVAEARGLIAVSSRIVRALDAVPGGVIPMWSARAPLAAPPFRVRPWMGIAAGLALVVGTAYVMRESTQEAFGPAADAGAPTVAQVSVPAERAPVQSVPAQTAPAPATTVATAGERREEVAAAREQSVAPLRQLADDARRDAGGAGNTGTVGAAANQSAPVAIAPAPPATAPALAPAAAAKTAAEEDRSRARALISSERLSQVVTTGSYGPKSPAATLGGCWRASAPDSLVAVYRDLAIVRSVGDTLLLLLPNARTVLVVRDRDTLRGALTANREACPPRP